MEKFDKAYLEMATVWARNSYCKRRQVGALIVKDRMIISDGYNGTPRMSARTRTASPNLMSFMQRQMQSRRLQSPATAARARLSMSQHPRAWSARNS